MERPYLCVCLLNPFVSTSCLDVLVLTIFITVNKWARHIWDIPVCWMTGEFMKVLSYTVPIFTRTSRPLLALVVILMTSSGFSSKP